MSYEDQQQLATALILLGSGGLLLMPIGFIYLLRNRRRR